MKKIKMCVLLASILGAFFVCKTKNSNSIYNDVKLSNIEALANSEMLEKGCVYEGSIECLNGGYSKWIILKFDDETSLY